MIESFFFSSRRRHTRCGRDWSSDVCSSDLDAEVVYSSAVAPQNPERQVVQRELHRADLLAEIGRASCRERMKILSRKPTALRLVNPSAAKIKIFTASAL